MMLFFLLPGLLAAQESSIPSAQLAPGIQDQVGAAVAANSSATSLNTQAAAAAVAAAQPGATGDTVSTQTLSRELNSERLWLLPRHAEFTDLLQRAALRALQHPGCNEVLYGSLNEFRSGRTGTSFTILCMQDERTTFNQIFFADELLTEEEQVANDTEPAPISEELQRLRRIMNPSAQQNAPAAPANQPLVPDNQPAPVVF